MNRNQVGLGLLTVALGCSIHHPPRPDPAAPGPGQGDRILSARRILVEIDWLPGSRPSQTSVEGAQRFLERYAQPAEGVRVALHELIPRLPGGRPFVEGQVVSDDQVFALHRARRNLVPEPGTEHLYLLFVPRRFDAEEARYTLGVAFPEAGFAVIGHETVHARSFLAIRGAEIERFVVQHELGHLLGLVRRDDHEVDGHCTHSGCLMYPRVDARVVLRHWWRAFTGRLPAGLDRDCRRDLEQRRRHPGAAGDPAEAARRSRPDARFSAPETPRHLPPVREKPRGSRGFDGSRDVAGASIPECRNVSAFGPGGRDSEPPAWC